MDVPANPKTKAPYQVGELYWNNLLIVGFFADGTPKTVDPEKHARHKQARRARSRVHRATRDQYEGKASDLISGARHRVEKRGGAAANVQWQAVSPFARTNLTRALRNGCPFTQLPFVMDRDRPKHPQSASLDRMDDRNEYTPDNSWPIPFALNMAFNDSRGADRHDVFKVMLAYVWAEEREYDDQHGDGDETTYDAISSAEARAWASGIGRLEPQ